LAPFFQDPAASTRRRLDVGEQLAAANYCRAIRRKMPAS
jgi:hypothetical protein